MFDGDSAEGKMAQANACFVIFVIGVILVIAGIGFLIAKVL